MRISRLLAALVVLGLAACSYEPPNGPPGDYLADRTLLYQQAIEGLARWDAAAGAAKGPLFLPLNGGVHQIGDWEPSLVPNKDDLERDKVALVHGDG